VSSLQALPHLKPGFVELARAVEVAALEEGVAAPPRGTDDERGFPSAPSGEGDLLSASPRDLEAASAPAGSHRGVEGGPGAPTSLSAEGAIGDLLTAAFAAGAEGVMLKRLAGQGSAYQPSRRSESWLKIKRCVSAHSSGVPGSVCVSVNFSVSGSSSLSVSTLRAQQIPSLPR
jgi:hypothetical protein